jgi:HK97 family phage portal protein
LPNLETQVAAAVAGRAWSVPVTSLPAVVACRTLIADTMGQLQLTAIRDGTALPVQPPVVRRPDPSEPTWLTWHRMGMALTGAGRAWVLITSWDAADRPASTKVLDPATVAPEYNELGEVVGAVWQGRTFAVPSEVVHIPNIVDADQLGVGPLQLCAAVFLQTAELYGFRGSYYSDGGVPSVKIIVPNRLTTEQANAERDAYVASRYGRRIPAVVSGGTDVVPFAATAAEAELGAALEAASAEIARVFRVMPSLINVATAGSLTYSTTAEHFRAWLITGLQAYLMRVEACYSDLLPRGQYARFDTSDLLRSDFGAQINAYSTALAGQAWLTVDEVRAATGRPPLAQVDEAPPVQAPNLGGL